ncbi:hypothetical protein BPAE_0242g00040 [Botrytis paeoniae]|uniref:Fungal STAND N-terminal Goodbye domain-containing protein n=1 Tax=Botrytis paeoniae TaxID=278948 RepID=A0A4Z1FC89_9HELO|nr:hypothetical protein BPAE_0242g00040 [Botrytis paeoniae]
MNPLLPTIESPIIDLELQQLWNEAQEEFLTFLKDDSGIKDELSYFKNLIMKQNDLTGVVTLKSVLDNSAVADKILKRQELFTEPQSRISDKVTYVEGDLKAKKDKKIISDRVEKIAKLLSIPEGAAKANIASEELKNIRKQFPEDAFKWLSAAYEYNEWLGLSDYACASPFRRLLNVYGEVKTGKSCLVASIEEDLNRMSTKSSSNNDMVYALKSMALQLATQSKTFAAALSQLKEKDLRITDTRESFLEFLREQRRSFASEGSLQILILVTGSHGANFGHNPLDFVINLARSNTALGEATLQALTTALTTAENEIHRVDLLVYQSLLIAGRDETNIEHLQYALICWKNCGRISQVLALKPGAYDYERNIFTLQSRLLAHFRLAIKTRQDNPRSQHEQQLLDP